MLKIVKIDDYADLSEFKRAYFEQATAALDGMWHFGFVSMASHFGFYHHNQLVGFCCVDQQGMVLQFYLAPNLKLQANALFKLLFNNMNQSFEKPRGAVVSTAEPKYLGHCLDHLNFSNVIATTYIITQPQPTNIQMDLAKTDQLATFVDFATANTELPANWITDYYSNLIVRQELWGYWQGSRLFAVGECRKFDNYQQQYAELGVIVNLFERGKGLATKVLCFLVNQANYSDLVAICSTESDNIAAQKAILNAGFSENNKILQFYSDTQQQ